MKFPSPLTEGHLIRRYKRFLADVELLSGKVITAHTANTGAMTGCAEPGSRVWLSLSDNQKRKYPHTWEIVEIGASNQRLVGINTQLSNSLVHEAIKNQVVKEFSDYNEIKTEVRYGEEKSRIDLLLQSSSPGIPDCYVEVKNVTLFDGRIAYFPDAVTVRGAKHLRELARVAEKGFRAVIFYCIQCEAVDEVRPAVHIDKTYSETLTEVVQHGVEVLAYRAKLSTDAIVLTDSVPVKIQ